MSRILHRRPRETLPVACGGDGVYLIDSAGKKYLDACGGAAVSCLGHNHPAVLQALRAQLDKISYAHTLFFTTEVLEELAARIINDAPANFSHAYFVSGGSEAVEAALKLARQYFFETGEPQREYFIARRQSYHGATLGALSVGGNAQRRAPFEAVLKPAAHIAPCYAYREQRENETETQYALRAADELEEKILQLGADRVIAFIAETIVGASAGVVPPAPGYFARVREICDRYGVLLILDEVMCGMGRSGDLYAHPRENVRADLVTLAKALGGGYQPIGAVLMDARIYGAVTGGSGVFSHSHTYLGHALAASAALAVQQTIARENLLDNVRARGGELLQALRMRFAEHAHVGDIRGRGLFIGIELVAERESKTPFAEEIPLHNIMRACAMQNGLMIYPGSGGIDGARGHHIMLAPPFIFTRAHVDELVGKLEKTFHDGFARAQKSA